MGLDCKHTKLFFAQFLDIGKSTGSLFGEIINLFKMFQKLSAPSEFQTKFAIECYEILSWATNIFKIISTSVGTDPLTYFEVYSIYTYVFPLTILCFITGLSAKTPPLYYYIIDGIFLMLGVGISFYGVNINGFIGCVATAGTLILIFVLGILIDICSHGLKSFFRNLPFIKKHEEGEAEIAYGNLLHATFISCLVFCGLIYKIVVTRYKAQIALICAIMLVVVISICFTTITRGFMPNSFQKTLVKVIYFIVNIFPLLLIPSAENFVSVIEGNYKGEWKIIVSFAGITLFIPFALSLVMVIRKNPDIVDKYRKSSFRFVELVDSLRQLAYALLAAYDILWGCLSVEIAWITLVLILRPYVNKSEYSLSVGSSLVVIISNSCLLYAHYHPSVTFGIEITIVLIVLACIPAVLSLYLYFALDFSVDEEEKDAEELKLSIVYLSDVAIMISPLAWFFYGLILLVVTGEIPGSRE